MDDVKREVASRVAKSMTYYLRRQEVTPSTFAKLICHSLLSAS
jgi:hypothetical protein